MTSTALTVIRPPENSLSLDPQQEWWTTKQLAILRQIGVEGANDGDLAVFFHVCQRTGLDPFARQIYMIARDGKQTIQTGIDGYRLIARRAADVLHHSLGIGSPEWCGPDGQWVDVWLSDGPPAAARATVHRNGGTFSAVALWREYVQTKRGGEITRMWLTRPAGQLAKCAEALALRKAFPQDLSGVYVTEEMDHSTPTLTASVEAPRSGADRMAAALHKDEPEPAEADDTPPTGTGELLTERQHKHLFALWGQLGRAGKEQRDERIAWLRKLTGRDIDSSDNLTADEASDAIELLKIDVEAQGQGDPA